MKRGWLVLVLVLGAFSVSLFGQSTRISNSGTLPHECVAGNIYHKTGANAGLYLCTAPPGTWTLLASAAGSGTIVGGTCASGSFMTGIDSSGTITCATGWTEVTAVSDQDVASSTSPANDNELFFTMVANALYEFELHLAYSSPAGGGTPDLKFQFAGPATLTGQRSLPLYPATNDSLSGVLGQDGLTTSGAVGTATTPRLVYMRGWAFSTGGGSGTSGLMFQWSQNASGVNPTRRLAGSILRYRRLL